MQVVVYGVACSVCVVQFGDKVAITLPFADVDVSAI